MRSGQLVLIDAGAEYQGYASDITRTFPVNGRFSKEQKALYELVLEAQAAAIAQVKPGNHWNDPHEAAVKVITRGLVQLGLLKGRVDTLIREEAYKPFYMHRTGHWLGLDVHDVGDYKVDNEWRVLEAGMVLTIEPGLYTGDNPKIAKKWRNIGIRIEDDVLVTRAGHEILSIDAPKSVAEIERLMTATIKSLEEKQAESKKAVSRKAIRKKKVISQKKVISPKKAISRKKAVTKTQAVTKKQTVSKKKAVSSKKAISSKKAVSPKKAVTKKKASPKKVVTKKKAVSSKKAVSKKKAISPKKAVSSKKAASKKKAVIKKKSTAKPGNRTKTASVKKAVRKKVIRKKKTAVKKR